jgi:hypothetical protein
LFFGFACTILTLLQIPTYAKEKIDINKYDIIHIIKNAPSFIIDMELDSVEFTYKGKVPYKIIHEVWTDCKKLGFRKNKNYTSSKDANSEYRYYTKKLKNGIDAVCEENIFYNGNNNVTILIDGND